MKKNKCIYLSLLLLCSFLSSFGLGTFQSLQTGYAKYQHTQKTSVAKDESSSDSNSNYFIEKTENESEQSSQALDFAIVNDFRISFVQQTALHTFFTRPSLELSVQKPIYLSTRNLRI